MATYSYSGADAQVFIWFDQNPSIVRQLEDITTISISEHEAKGQARALGFRGIKGISRGIRTIAGSMIFTVVEDNPLRPLLETTAAALDNGTGRVSKPLGWSIDQNEVGIGTALERFQFANKIAPLIPPFNVLIQYVSEASGFYDPTNGGVFDTEWHIPGAAILLRGVEFIDEGIVTSVHDIVSEVTLSFVALDVKPMSKMDLTGGGIAFADLGEHQRKEAELREMMYGERDQRRREQTRIALESLGYRVGEE